jgi:transcriptional regulator with XRE-family HTH domain
VELKERIATIVKENHLKQKELAALMGVTESYVSTLMSGRNQNVSISVANLIEEKLGYNAQWVLTGEEPKYKQLSKNPDISDIHRRVIMQIEKMSDSEVKAVLAFVDTLESLNKRPPN